MFLLQCYGSLKMCSILKVRSGCHYVRWWMIFKALCSKWSITYDVPTRLCNSRIVQWHLVSNRCSCSDYKALLFFPCEKFLGGPTTTD